MTGRELNKFAWMEALRGADLTHAEYRVALNLSTFARGDLTNARPGLAKLCAAAQVRPQTAKLALRTLAEKGWIELAEEGGNQHGKGKANVYTLTFPKGDGERSPTGGKGAGHRSPSDSARETVSADKGDGRQSGRGTVSVVEGGRSPSPHQWSDQVTTSEKDHSPRHLSNAGASARVAERDEGEEISAIEARVSEAFASHAVDAEPIESGKPRARRPALRIVDDPAGDKDASEGNGWMDRVSRQLPGGFRPGELEVAVKAYAQARDVNAVVLRLLRARETPKRGMPRRRAYINDRVGGGA